VGGCPIGRARVSVCGVSAGRRSVYVLFMFILYVLSGPDSSTFLMFSGRCVLFLFISLFQTSAALLCIVERALER